MKNSKRKNPSAPEIRAFLFGIKERNKTCGVTFDDDPFSPRSIAYDEGRNVGEYVVTPEWRNFIVSAIKAYTKSTK